MARNYGLITSTVVPGRNSFFYLRSTTLVLNLRLTHTHTHTPTVPSSRSTIVSYSSYSYRIFSTRNPTKPCQGSRGLTGTITPRRPGHQQQHLTDGSNGRQSHGHCPISVLRPQIAESTYRYDNTLCSDIVTVLNIPSLWPFFFGIFRLT